MPRIFSKLASVALITGVTILGACAAMDRDAMSENSRSAPTPTPQAQATSQQEAQTVTPTAPAPAAAPTSFTDAQLRAFVNASRQIEPLNRQVPTATPEQRTALATQIRGILTENNLDGATYNAIATRAQTDQALAQRIAAMQTNPNG